MDFHLRSTENIRLDIVNQHGKTLYETDDAANVIETHEYACLRTPQAHSPEQR
jgi:hypothetical protein